MNIVELYKTLGVSRTDYLSDYRWNFTEHGSALEAIAPGCSVLWDTWPNWENYYIKIDVQNVIYKRLKGKWYQQKNSFFAYSMIAYLLDERGCIVAHNKRYPDRLRPDGTKYTPVMFKSVRAFYIDDERGWVLDEDSDPTAL